MAITIGLSGWLGINAKSADTYLIIAGSIVVVLSSFFAYTRHKRINQLLQEIEDAKPNIRIISPILMCCIVWISGLLGLERHERS